MGINFNEYLFTSARQNVVANGQQRYRALRNASATVIWTEIKSS
jgi:hypothetical protein